MATVSEILKQIGAVCALFLFVGLLVWLTKPSPLLPGTVTEKWYDQGYYLSVDGRIGTVSPRTYYRVSVGGWYDGER